MLLNSTFLMRDVNMRHLHKKLLLHSEGWNPHPNYIVIKQNALLTYYFTI